MLIFFVGAVSAQNKYVGVKKCGMCHKKDKTGNQLKVWKGSLHSKAFETLKSKEADEISMKKDGKKAAENPNCLKCHAPQYNVDAKLLGKKFKLEQGVQCETCHGPGSAYAKMKIMKDKEKSIEKGLHLYKDPAKELCVKCHNEESPNYKGFDFEKYWAKIKHTNPNK
ncbi:MAG: cytochrome C554 [Ignavibacteria bacterium]|nr:MAG: cytochrome C554 [Ignavibacteria bacterium]